MTPTTEQITDLTTKMAAKKTAQVAADAAYAAFTAADFANTATLATFNGAVIAGETSNAATLIQAVIDAAILRSDKMAAHQAAATTLFSTVAALNDAVQALITEATAPPFP